MPDYLPAGPCFAQFVTGFVRRVVFSRQTKPYTQSEFAHRQFLPVRLLSRHADATVHDEPEGAFSVLPRLRRPSPWYQQFSKAARISGSLQLF